MKNIGVFVSENFQFLEVKFSICLNKNVFVMMIFFCSLLVLVSSVIPKLAYQSSRYDNFLEINLLVCTNMSGIVSIGCLLYKLCCKHKRYPRLSTSLSLPSLSSCYHGYIIFIFILKYRILKKKVNNWTQVLIQPELHQQPQKRRDGKQSWQPFPQKLHFLLPNLI